MNERDPGLMTLEASAGCALVAAFLSLLLIRYLSISLTHFKPSSPASASLHTAMASTTKYQAAPTRDSFEEQSYSQPPPSYQAEASGVPGVPRDEDDNVPDDFKVRCIATRKAGTIILTYHSLVVLLPKRLSTSVCNSSARSTPSSPSNFSRPPLSHPSHSSAPDTRHGSRPTSG